MKRVRCPKCDNYIVFDEKKYEAGQSLVFVCSECNFQFGIKIGVSKLKGMEKNQNLDEAREEEDTTYGAVVVLENQFHFKQILPLRMGDNIIGKYTKGCKATLPIETSDPSVDLTHCIINVSRTKKGKIQYTLRDAPSFTGTFVDNEILGDKERRIITDGALFTIGATTLILKL